MSSSSNKPNRKKKIIRNAVVVKIGCGCRRPKLADVFRPRPKAKAPSDHHQKSDFHGSTSTSSWDRSRGFSINDDDYTTTSFSPHLDTTPPIHSEAEAEAEAEAETHYDTTTKECSESNTVKGMGRIGESVAVVKDSDDPYLDFRQSMLQMIMEKEIYDKKELRDLLDCFLQLNSPYHHEIIVQAFSEICNGFFAVTTTDPSGSGGPVSASLKPPGNSREFWD